MSQQIAKQTFQLVGSNKVYTVDYETGDSGNGIGQGAQGTVYRVAQINGKPYGTWAIKILVDVPSNIKAKLQERLYALVQFMNGYSVNAEGLSCVPSALLQSKPDNKLAILMRYAPDYDLENGGKLPSMNSLPQRLAIASQLAKSIRRLHEKGTVIGDISNDNVIVDHLNWALYLIDLDGVSFSQNGKVYPLLTDNSGKGSFCPPEFNSKKPYTIEMDLWGLATLLHFILTDCYPMEKDLFGLARTYASPNALAWPPSNHPKSNEHFEKLDIYGGAIKNAFLTAFNDGRLSPEKRPSALDWDNILTEAQKYMYQCNCTKDKPFVAVITNGQQMSQCPKCGAEIPQR